MKETVKKFYSNNRFILVLAIFFVLTRILIIRLSLITLLSVILLFVLYECILNDLAPVYKITLEIIFLLFVISFYVFQIQQLQLIRNTSFRYFDANVAIEDIDVNIKKNYARILAKSLEKDSYNLRILIYTPVDGNIKLYPGDVIRIHSVPEKLRPSRMPGERNRTKYYLSKRVYFVSRIKTQEHITLLSRIKGFNIKRFAFSAREYLRNEFIKSCGEETASLVIAMLYGDDSLLDERTIQHYKSFGLMHVLVASGNTINIILSVVLSFDSFLPIPSKYKNVFAIFVLIFFCLLNNGELAFLRALIMKCIETLTILNKRQVHKKDILFASVLILGLKAENFLNQGFLMSSLATYVLIIRSNFIKHEMNRRFLSVMKERISTYLWIQFSFIPFIYILGSEHSFLALVCNFLLLPVFEFLLLLTIFFIFSLKISILIFYLSVTLRFITTCLNEIFLFLEIINQPFVFHVKRIHYVILLTFIVIKVFRTFFITYSKKFKFLYFGIASVVLVFIMTLIFVEKNKCRLYFLDIDQGSCSLFVDKDEVLLFDLGPNKRARALCDFLFYIEKDKIDHCFLSHLDADHVAGIEEVLDRGVIIKNIYLADKKYHTRKKLDGFLQILSRYPSINIQYISEICEVHTNQSSVQMFVPSVVHKNDNENSLQVLLNSRLKVFFPGDAGYLTEKEILQFLSSIDIDVLVLSHHGADSASSRYFLNTLHPKFTVISSGYRNRYGHPKKEVLDRIPVESKVYRTDLQATIIMKLCHNYVRIYTSNRNIYMPATYDKISTLE